MRRGRSEQGPMRGAFMWSLIFLCAQPPIPVAFLCIKTKKVTNNAKKPFKKIIQHLFQCLKPSNLRYYYLHASRSGACSFLLVQKRTKKRHPKTKLPVFGVEYGFSFCTTVVNCIRTFFSKQPIFFGP